MPWPPLPGRLVATGVRRAATLALALAIAFGAGAGAERAGLLPGAPPQEPASAPADFGLFWQAWDLVQQHYVDRSAIDPKRLTYGAIEGMLGALGDSGHTGFLTPAQRAEEEQALGGTLVGIGVELDAPAGTPVIVSVLAGSPAERAGLRPGDRLVSVDCRPLVGLALDRVIDLVRGPEGSAVGLAVERPGVDAPLEFQLTRARIAVPAVGWAMVPGTAVADLRVERFSTGAADELKAALRAALARGARALVLDLRRDPGGYTHEAVGVASQFLASGTVYLTQDAAGGRTATPVQAGGIATDLPLAVLVDGGTASSAEIVAAALQDAGRAPLMGTPTYGTGTVLSTYPLADGSEVRIGTAEWLTPLGRPIWHAGLAPTIMEPLPAGRLPLTPVELAGLDPAGLRAAGDVQLLAAVDLVAWGGRGGGRGGPA